ncbi:S-adenosyl-L-methionine-dependent methyltransferase [Schizophyllum fasciatum]
MAVKALEFYSGIGGLHLALERSKLGGQVACAFDWDQAAEKVYRANFSTTPVKRVRGHALIARVDISTLTAASLRTTFPDVDLWLLSPACQPYTVLNPNGKGERDPRAQSFLHLMQVVLPCLARDGSHPKYLLVENVGGFEQSTTRQLVLSVMRDLGYYCAEFLLTPLQFGIPNSRLRYYLLARRHPFSPALSESGNSIMRYIPGHGTDVPWVDPRTDSPLAESYILAQYAIPNHVLLKWGWLFDIVLPKDRRTCCFTRGYTKLVERSGSILQMNENLDSDPAQALIILHSLGLRYFTPDELLHLFGFTRPNSADIAYGWPKEVSEKTKFRLIGNSVNVAVVASLLDYLL